MENSQKAEDFIKFKIVEVPNVKLRAGHVKILRKRVMMVVVVVVETMVKTLVVVMVVVKMVVVVVDGIGGCGNKLEYPPTHQVSPSCHIYV